MNEYNPSDEELVRLEKKDREDAKQHIPPLIASEGWDILRSYGEIIKGRLMVELMNHTEDALKQDGKSHDGLSGQIRGIVTMLNGPEVLLGYAKQFEEEEKDEPETE